MVAKKWIGVLVAMGLGPGWADGAAGQLASLVADLPAASVSHERSSNPNNFERIGERAVFTAEHPLLGLALWTTAGTAADTEPLLGLHRTDNSIRVATSADLLWFTTTRADSSARVLWRTDGTRAGTLALGVANNPQLTDSGAKPIVVGSRLFFGAYSDETGHELWTSDGTPQGTHPVGDLSPGLGPFFLAGMTEYHSRLYFLARVNENVELWTTDGTPHETRRIKSFSEELVPEQIVAASDRLHLLFQDGSHTARQIWASDGTPQGTDLVTTTETEWLLPLDDRVFFVAEDPGHGQELWSSDGTPGSIVRLTDFAEEFPFPSRHLAAPLSADQIARIGNRVAFLALNSEFQLELWVADTTRLRSQRLAALGNAAHCQTSSRRRLHELNGTVIFETCQDLTLSSLWATDGTIAGSVRLRGDMSSFDYSGFSAIAGSDNEVYFVDALPSHGLEIFSSDGTLEGTRRRTELPNGFSFETFPPDLSTSAAVFGPTLLFSASADEIHGTELWAADLLPSSTRLLMDIVAEAASSRPRHLVDSPTGTLFVADISNLDTGLWRISENGSSVEFLLKASDIGCSSLADLRGSGPRTFILCELRPFGSTVLVTDGTIAGTIPILQVPWFDPTDVTVAELGNRSYVASARAGTIWRTDGTPSGSEAALTEIQLGITRIVQLRSLGNSLYFVGEGQSLRVFRTDGSLAGTQVLAEVGRSVRGFWELSGDQYFFATDDNLSSALYRSDGTPAGTVEAVALSALGVELLEGRDLVVKVGEKLVFLGWNRAMSRWELWRTDGTASGTTLLSDALDVSVGASNWRVAVMNGRAFLRFQSVGGGFELWQTDASPEGTGVIARIEQPGESSAVALELVPSGNLLFLAGNHGRSGVELWVTDGTAEGTRLVHDIAPGPFSSSPEQLTLAGNRLYFTADDGIHGRELWSLNLDETGCVPNDHALCLQDGRFRVEADWKDFQGNEGRGTAVSLTPDTGYFWFFNSGNVEAVLKMLDGRGLNDHFWTFYGALSTVEYNLTITDAETGVSRRYYNPPGNLASRADTASFGPNGASLERDTPPAEQTSELAEIFRTDSLDVLAPRGTCAPASNRLCLRNGRFAVEATWRDFQGHTGTGTAVPITGDTGTFWFFRPENLEVILKVLDGTGLNGRHWVFYGALSSVEYTLTVTDTSTGAVRTYFNPLGRLASVADTGAF